MQSRAEAALEQLRDGFPGDPLGGRLTPDEGRLDVYFAAHAGLACPALDRGTGRCDLYDDRPVACRTYGPPLRFGEQAASHCRLCFRGASAAQVERARWEPDPRGLERSLLDAAGAPPDEHWFTLIAFALAPQAGSAMERSIDG